jgi:hypothetical protein
VFAPAACRSLHNSGVTAWEKTYKQQVQTRDRSVKAFKAFITEKTTISRELVQRYREIAALELPSSSALAAARIAMIHESFAHELANIAVPSSFKTSVEYNAYCAANYQQSAPLRREAADAYQQCIEIATRAGGSDDIAVSCARDVERVLHRSSRAPQELYAATPVPAALTLERVDVVTE